MTIEITDNDSRPYWTVKIGERYEQCLCRDECLFLVASLLVRGYGSETELLRSLNQQRAEELVPNE